MKCAIIMRTSASDTACAVTINSTWKSLTISESIFVATKFNPHESYRHTVCYWRVHKLRTTPFTPSVRDKRKQWFIRVKSQIHSEAILEGTARLIPELGQARTEVKPAWCCATHDLTTVWRILDSEFKNGKEHSQKSPLIKRGILAFHAHM